MAFFCTTLGIATGLWAPPANAQVTPLTDVQLTGVDNQIQNGSELTVMNGGTLTAASGSVVDLFNATVALPNSLTLTDTKFSGPNNQLLNGSTLTLSSGSTFIAAAGSTINLSAAGVSFPTTVVLTTGNQTLTGKTLDSPIISSVTSAPATNLTLAGSGSGARLTLGQGANGVATFSSPVSASNLNIGSSKLLTVSNTLTFSGTDSSTLNIGTGGTLQSGAFTNVGANVRLYGATGDGTTNDAAAVTAAIAAAGTNGLVLFPAGDYAIASAIAPLAGQTLKFMNGAILRMIPSGAFGDGQLIQVLVNDVTIDGAIFSGRPANTGTMAVNVFGAQRVTLIRCTGSNLLTRLAIFSASSHYGRVLNCISPGTGPSGHASNHLEFNNSNYCLAQGNTFYGGGANGCEIYQNSGSQILGTRVVDNVFDGVGSSGVNMYGSVGAIVAGNVFRNTSAHGVFITVGEVNSILESNGNVIESNYFENCGTTGGVPIYVNQSRNQIRNNSIFCNNINLISGTAMLTLNNGDDISVSGNFISGGYNGIYVNSQVRRPIIENNTIMNVGWDGAQANGSPRGIEIDGSAGQILSNSIVDTRAPGQRGVVFAILAIGNNNSFSRNIYINASINFYDIGTGNIPDGQVTSTVATGTPPLVVASTTNVPNLNASLLNGATFAAPGAIGGGTPSTGSFTSLSGDSLTARAATNLQLNGGSSGASLILGNGPNAGIALTGFGAGRITGTLNSSNVWSINPGVGLTAPNFVLGASGGKAIALLAGTSGSALVWDSTGFLDFASDSRTNLVGGSTNGGSSLARLTTNLLIGGTGDISGSGGLKVFGNTASTSPSSGAFQVAGGAGIGGALNVGAGTAIGGGLNVGGNAGIGGLMNVVGSIATTAATASTSTSTGALIVAGGFGLAGDQFLGGSLHLSSGGVLSGSAASLSLTASGTNQSVTLTPSGTGILATPAPFTAAGPIMTTAVIASTSTTTGALVVNGGFGLAGDQYLGGALNFTGAGVISTGGSLALTAGGANQNITLTPSGTGILSTAAPIASGGAISTTATTASASTSSGALVVAGGFGLAGDQYLGGSLNLTGGGKLSGTSGSVGVTAGGTNQNITLTPSGTGSIVLAGPVTYSGAQTFNSTLNFPGGGAVSGSAGSLALTASGSNQNIALSPSGTGLVTTGAAFRAGGALSTTATTASSSTTTGALVVAGGVGVAGDQYLGGSLNLSGGGVLTGSAGSLTLSAAGSNQNISLAPSGSGIVSTTAPFTAAGAIKTTATTDSSSTSTGALVVGGGAAVQKKMFLGDDLMLVPTASSAATVRLSGTAVANTPGLWLSDGGFPTAANVALTGNSTSTILNSPSGGSVSLRLANSPYLTVTTSAATLQNVPLSVTATTASVSTTTGSATFAGGIGVAGRTTTKSLSVGGGSAVDLILTAIATLDFPSIAPNGGVQDLAVTVNGASLADSVNIVEANGSFIQSGVVLRAIVTATNTVTVRATNTTTAAIDPASAPYRLTIISF